MAISIASWTEMMSRRDKKTLMMRMDKTTVMMRKDRTKVMTRRNKMISAAGLQAAQCHLFCHPY